jgi:chaperonin GroES
MKLVAIEDHILVEPFKEENTTASGIILPNDDKEKPSKGKVIAVGTGKILDNGHRGPMDVAVGDTIYFTKYSPDELEINDGGEKKKILVIRHSSILAKE